MSHTQCSEDQVETFWDTALSGISSLRRYLSAESWDSPLGIVQDPWFPTNVAATSSITASGNLPFTKSVQVTRFFYHSQDLDRRFTAISCIPDRRKRKNLKEEASLDFLAMFAWLFGSATRPPILLRLRSSNTFITFTVSTAFFTDIFVYGILVPVLPFTLTSRTSVSTDHVQTWIALLLAVYAAALLFASPFVGWLADRLDSRRVPLLAGLLALGGATALLCVGSSMTVLIVARILQGLSAAVVGVVSLALLVDTMGPEEIGSAMGYVGLSMSLAVLLAPLLGGVVFAASGYYSVFAMAFGLILIDIILRVCMMEKKVAERFAGVMQTGIRESTEEVTVENPQSTQPQERANGSAAPMAVQDRVTANPCFSPKLRLVRRLPPVLTLVASRRLFSALLGSAMQSTLLAAFDSILPLYVRNTFGWDSTGAGLIFLALVIPTFISPAVGWLSDKYGSRWLAAMGFALACPCMILLRLVDHDSTRQKVILCALLSLVGLCLSTAITPIMAEITYAVNAKTQRHPPGHFGRNGAYAQAYSLWNMAWAVGSLVGPLLGGLVEKSGGWATTTLILGILCAITAIPVAIWAGGSMFKQRSQVRRQARAEPIRARGDV